jgi:hypothetical protein
MGLVRMGPPHTLIEKIVSSYRVQNFVETGTYHGETSIWASNIFKNVFTIENSVELHKQTANKYREIDNIEFLLGDSRMRLKETLEKLEEPTLVWLDAHWSGDSTYGKMDQCPLLEEIGIINSLQPNLYLFIDDARLFLSPPHPPHDVNQWPNIVEVVNSLQSNPDRYVVIIEDCIIAAPIHARPLIIQYCQDINSNIWEDYTSSLKTPGNFRKGVYLIRLGIKSKFKGISRNIRTIIKQMSHPKGDLVDLDRL